METLITISKIVVLVSGLFLILLGVLMKTKNFASAFVFNFLPIILGIGNILAYLVWIGLVIVK